MLSNLLDAMKSEGYRVTPQRTEILRVMCSSPEPQTAQQILKKIQPRYPNVSLDTVYRTLHLFVRMGLACQINFLGGSSARFQIENAPHHHHMVCVSCGRSRRIDFCPIEFGADLSRQTGDFQVVAHAFEIYGYCPACQESEPGQGGKPPRYSANPV